MNARIDELFAISARIRRRTHTGEIIGRNIQTRSTIQTRRVHKTQWNSALTVTALISGYTLTEIVWRRIVVVIVSGWGVLREASAKWAAYCCIRDRIHLTWVDVVLTPSSGEAELAYARVAVDLVEACPAV